jgi:hypothetical protein
MSASVLPHQRLADIDARLVHAAARPVIVPETIVCDHGKAFISHAFRASCRFLGINLQPARKATPTDKAHVERTIAAVGTLFAQYLAGYVGRGVEHRGWHITADRLWSLREAQDLLDEWIVTVWQNRPHDGLRDPLAPGRAFSPNEKYATLLESAGYAPAGLDPDDYVELLPSKWQTIGAAGVRIGRRTYDCDALDVLRGQPSGITTRNDKVGDPLRPLRRLPGLGPRPPRDRLDHAVLEAPSPGSDPVRRAGLEPRPTRPARAQRGRTRRRHPGPADPRPHRKHQKRRPRPAGPSQDPRHRCRTRRRSSPIRQSRAERGDHGPGRHRRPAGDLRPVPRSDPRMVSTTPGLRPLAIKTADTHRHLSTLAGWRQFTTETVLVPELLPAAHWQRLTDADRTAYDDTRLDYHTQLAAVATSLLRQVVTTGRRLTLLNRHAVSARRGLILSGPAGTGKTTAITQFGKTHQAIDAARHPGLNDRIPVLYITVPPAATPRMVAAEFARFLGLPMTSRANITDIIEAVCGVAVDAHVTVVAVDEIHNLTLATRNGGEVSDTLKYFSERIPATFIYAGINVEKAGLFSGVRGSRIAGRFTMIPTTPFPRTAEWNSLIATIENALRLHRHKPGGLLELTDYLHHRTAGMIGSLSHLVRGAALDAILTGAEKITKKLLDAVELDHAAQDQARRRPVTRP